MSEAVANEDIVETIKSLMDQQQKRYLKLGEAPAYANVSLDTFKKWRSQGLIPITVINGIQRVDRYDIDKLFLKYKVGHV